MFQVMLQSEEVAYSTKRGNCLQTYTLGHECHRTKPGDEKKNINTRNLWRMGDITLKMYKLQRVKTKKGTNMF
jgi:hypothetical protein